jgi:hypothetical protein
MAASPRLEKDTDGLTALNFDVGSWRIVTSLTASQYVRNSEDKRTCLLGCFHKAKIPKRTSAAGGAYRAGLPQLGGGMRRQ